jgi:hypothetical protein
MDGTDLCQNDESEKKLSLSPMQPVLFFLSLLFVFSVAAEVSLAQTANCSFNITGIWQVNLPGNKNTNQVFYKFAADGTVTLLTRRPWQKASTFRQTAQLRYRLDNPTAPKFIEFIADNTLDIFPAGKTIFPISDFDEHRFTAHKPSLDLLQWVRVPERRYFLTFAARNGTFEEGGLVFALWTEFDGGKAQFDALGFYINGNTGTFGVIPARLYNEFITDQIAGSDVMLRIELNASEFERTRKIWKVWHQRARTDMLLYSVPHLNLMSFLTRVIESLNRCGARLKVHKLDWSVADEMATQYNLPQIPLQYIKELKKLNHSQHITQEVMTENFRSVQLLSKP